MAVPECTLTVSTRRAPGDANRRKASSFGKCVGARALPLRSCDVVNSAGEKLGTLDEIMLDVPAVESPTQYFPPAVPGHRRQAVRHSLACANPENKCFILDVSKERLEQAPGFDKDHWPTMADEIWAREVHTYYSARPYWECERALIV